MSDTGKIPTLGRVPTFRLPNTLENRGRVVKEGESSCEDNTYEHDFNI